MGSTPLEYCWFIYKIGARTGRLTGQFETYAHTFDRMEAAARAGAGIVLDEADVQLLY